MILTHRLGGPSSRLLRDAIEEVSGVRYLITSKPEKVSRLHVRWGNYARLPFDTKYNSREVVTACTFKRRFSRILREAGIDTPTFYSKSLPTNEDYPVMVRKTLQGKGGEGIVVCPDSVSFKEVWQPDYTWTRFVTIQNEYRAHIFNGEVYRIFKKLYTGDGNEPEFPIRNGRYRNEYRYSLRTDHSKFPKLIDDIRRVTEVMGSGFYALDVGWRPDVKNYFYFEANSAPGLNTNTALELAKRLHNVGAV
jgi:hypothetical protein